MIPISNIVRHGWISIKGHSILYSSIVHIEWFLHTENTDTGVTRTGSIIVHLSNGDCIRTINQAEVDMFLRIIEN